MTRTVNSISILLPDGENHIAIHVINCLAQVHGIQIYLMSNTYSNPMRFSRHLHKFIKVANVSKDEKWIEQINHFVVEDGIDIIMPIFEDAFRSLIKYRDLISQQTQLVHLPTLENFDIAINKWSLFKHCEKFDIPVPPTYFKKQSTDLFDISKFKFPVLVKPTEGYGGGQGIEVLTTLDEVKDFFNSRALPCNYLVQEYILGYDIDCSVLCKKGDIITHTIQKGNLKGKSDFSPQIGLQFKDNEEFYSVIKKIMKSLEWSGIAHIDARYDQQNNCYKIVEINCRFWVSLDASLLAGVNFPYLYALSSLKNEISPSANFQTINYLSLKGMIRNFWKRNGYVDDLQFLWNNTPLKFAVKDPLPMLYKFCTRTINLSRGYLKKRFG